MFVWIKKKDLKALLNLRNGLEGLIGQQELCQEGQARLRRDMDNLDIDMSQLYDKVQHALSRMGGRKSTKKNGEAPAPEYDINEAIRQGVYDGSRNAV